MRAGRWLFVHRGWLPVPLLGVLLLGPPGFRLGGLAVIGAGEVVRLAAVGHIGLVSRTRGEAVGALVDTGPYARMRNPLYLGNILIYAGIGLTVRPEAAVGVPLLMAYYALIVRWEEQNLERLLGAPYREYLRRVPRWFPTGSPRVGSWDARRALRSERSTLLALAAILALLRVRAAVG